MKLVNLLIFVVALVVIASGAVSGYYAYKKFLDPQSSGNGTTASVPVDDTPKCEDNDGDGYGKNCGQGREDCDDKNNQKNKICSVEASFELMPDKTTVKKGEKFTVRVVAVNVPTDAQVTAFSLRMNYDANLLNGISSKSDDKQFFAIEKRISSKDAQKQESGLVDDSMVVVDIVTKEAPIKSGDELSSITFVALASGTAEIKMNQTSQFDGKYDIIGELPAIKIKVN